MKVPDDGLQSQAAVDPKGTIHLIYLYDDPTAADITYVRIIPGERDFSEPIRVNDQPGSAVALATVRGAHLSEDGLYTRRVTETNGWVGFLAIREKHLYLCQYGD
ncbi:MAG: hypothetical protein ACR2JB_12885 [Bryobacteraceae bacterium]